MDHIMNIGPTVHIDGFPIASINSRPVAVLKNVHICVTITYITFNHGLHE